MHDETNRKEADLNTEVVVTFLNCVTVLWSIPSSIIPKLLLNRRTKREMLLLSSISELSVKSSDVTFLDSAISSAV